VSHTPGPWKLWGWDPGQHMYSIAAGRIIVALVPNACSIHEILSRREPAIQMANVKLIAAAPDLLLLVRGLAEALKEAGGYGALVAATEDALKEKGL
jgi:hypothetical protein